MTEVLGQPKKNALMQLFSKRQPESQLQSKPIKKVKTNQNKQDDPLYKVLSWRDEYEQYTYPKDGTFKLVGQKSIIKADQSKWAQNVQGVFMNIDWCSISIEQLNQLKISQNLIHNGIIFVWGSKTSIGPMMDYFQKMNFFYVENFTFVLLNRKKIPQKSQKSINGNKSIFNFFKVTNNTSTESMKKKTEEIIEKDYQIGKAQNVTSVFCNQDSTYFKQTQKVLYMFRKLSKNQSLELRHQRTSDVYFTIGDSSKLDWKSKQIVYKMIQTLLISANYKQKQQLKLVQLWGQESKPRKGWVTVFQESQQQSSSLKKLQQTQQQIKQA